MLDMLLSSCAQQENEAKSTVALLATHLGMLQLDTNQRARSVLEQSTRISALQLQPVPYQQSNDFIHATVTSKQLGCKQAMQSTSHTDHAATNHPSPSSGWQQPRSSNTGKLETVHAEPTLVGVATPQEPKRQSRISTTTVNTGAPSSQQASKLHTNIEQRGTLGGLAQSIGPAAFSTLEPVSAGLMTTGSPPDMCPPSLPLTLLHIDAPAAAVISDSDPVVGSLAVNTQGHSREQGCGCTGKQYPSIDRALLRKTKMQELLVRTSTKRCAVADSLGPEEQPGQAVELLPAGKTVTTTVSKQVQKQCSALPCRKQVRRSTALCTLRSATPADQHLQEHSGFTKLDATTQTSADTCEAVYKNGFASHGHTHMVQAEKLPPGTRGKDQHNKANRSSAFHALRAWRHRRQQAAISIQAAFRRFCCRRRYQELQLVLSARASLKAFVLRRCLAFWRRWACRRFQLRNRYGHLHCKYGIQAHLHLRAAFDGRGILQHEGLYWYAASYRQWRLLAAIWLHWMFLAVDMYVTTDEQ